MKLSFLGFFFFFNRVCVCVYIYIGHSRVKRVNSGLTRLLNKLIF
jgi:hypothetical protein